MKSLKELMNLDGRTALITGGAGHIGSAIGEALAELGANIVVLDSSPSVCAEVANKIQQQFGPQTMPLSIDLADENSVRSAPEKVLTKFGRLDILVNCAAMVNTSNLKGWVAPFQEQGAEAWRLALEVNLTAPFILTQVFADALKASGHGSVINVSSIYGMVGPDMRLYDETPLGNAAAYGASKGGLLQLTRWLATVMAPHVRVNAISPGGVWRNQPELFVKRYEERTPLKRMGMEEDFKGAAAYLASDLSAYVTGQNLAVDGGWTAW
ncbi:MAG TPA: SDR family oxidoreductase [Anaerolineales bacterium]|nr:SDR family oxidoreductase [Anaerolineales bacterium]HNA88183.1 SDR family oxidoreductase [Anaerolineales bacterium]HNB35812.1 SDR family oxidoreductase [Anaerolineales bacterium]HNC07774.1 SDR family oxidoreductase [Anaerolineales bacterium]HND93429.1 SDR family oxidoreductase [Anaerolineales bacterium]